MSIEQEPDDVGGPAGHAGRPIAARCVGCKTVRRKLAPNDVGTERGRSSFKHVCHNCQKATWWNVVHDPEVTE